MVQNMYCGSHAKWEPVLLVFLLCHLSVWILTLDLLPHGHKMTTPLQHHTWAKGICQLMAPFYRDFLEVPSSALHLDLIV